MKFNYKDIVIEFVDDVTVIMSNDKFEYTFDKHYFKATGTVRLDEFMLTIDVIYDNYFTI